MAPLPPPAQGASLNLEIFFPGRPGTGSAPRRADRAAAEHQGTEQSLQRNQRRLPEPAGRMARHVPGHLLNGAWSAVKFNFTSSVSSPGKTNKTFVSFGDSAKVNTEPNVN